MGVKPIPVGGPQALDLFKSRDWRIPFVGLFYHEPISSTPGRRTATCTGVQYRAQGQALYMAPTQAAGNRVWEIGEKSLITMPPDGFNGGTILNGYFYFAVSMNQGSGNLANAAGECLQGFGIGSMERDTPWIGQLTNDGVCIHVRWNFTRLKWELFAASQSDVGNTVDLAIQPNFAVDQRIPEMAIEWIPNSIINVYCNQQLVHSQDINVLLPTEPHNSATTGQTGPIIFLTNGSNSAYAQVEAGFYEPRFFQPHVYQPVL